MMANKKEPIWYSFYGTHYNGSLPAFYPDPVVPAFDELAEHSSTVLNELQFFLQKENTVLPAYFNKAMIQGEGNWEVLHFMRWGESNTNITTSFPYTSALLSSIPGLTSAAITRLAPQTSILPHEGDTNAVIRCHLGLQIPQPLPECGMEVNGVQTSWECNKWFFFCDAHQHRAWNNTNEARIVLIADIIHPDYADQKAEVCNNVRSALELQGMEMKFPIVKRLPGFVRGFLRHYLKRKVKL
jgi:hypothetical protein